MNFEPKFNVHDLHLLSSYESNIAINKTWNILKSDCINYITRAYNNNRFNLLLV